MTCFVGVAGFALLVQCKTIDDPCEGACPADPSGDGGLVPDVVVPANCDETADADASGAAGCVVDSFAVFVNAAGGDDAADGSKARPVRTVGAAVARASATGKRRAYTCGAGPYEEAIVLKSAVSLLGGFACGSWAYDGVKARIAPAPGAYALHIDRAPGTIVLSDLELVAANATADGGNSVAVFVHEATARFVRADLRAGNGKKGADGEGGKPGTLTAVTAGSLMDLDGNAASGTTGGIFKDCTCSNGGPALSRGGGGGGVNTLGGNGLPARGGGTGGDASDAACGASGTGKVGGPGANVDPVGAALGRGSLTSAGWAPAGGTEGSQSGGPGQGGGGGGGANATNAGGGGACGGCGGTPGKAGGGGGASIALLTRSSTLELRSSSLSAGAAGAGGEGGAGGVGGGGGLLGGAGNCRGGGGGKGGIGSAASGGAGGVSMGLLYQRTAPSLDEATTSAITSGTVGAAGKGGAPGTNDGPPGVADKVREVSTF